MITDKEVGELWRAHKDCPGNNYCGAIHSLIRKLVEERAARYRKLAEDERGYVSPDARHEARDTACRDFGINPATWKES